MWKCKKCNNEVELSLTTILTKHYKLKNDKSLAILKSTDERMIMNYSCKNCENSSINLENIAYWEGKNVKS